VFFVFFFFFFFFAQVIFYRLKKIKAYAVAWMDGLLEKEEEKNSFIDYISVKTTKTLSINRKILAYQSLMVMVCCCGSPRGCRLPPYPYPRHWPGQLVSRLAGDSNS